jgi:hypothetical protein
VIEHIAMVYAAGGLSANEKHLLGAYCNHTDQHGYCWPSVPRLMDETGMSERTVQRTNVLLRKRKLVKAVRRVNPKTGLQISNLSRVNVPLLASLRRPARDYGDNLVEEITFEEDRPEASADAPVDNSFSQVIQGCQSGTPRGANLAPPPRQSGTPRGANLAPKTSVEPSGEPSDESSRPVRSVRTAQVGDARASATAPQAASEDQGTGSSQTAPARVPEPRQGDEAPEINTRQGAGGSRRSGARSASQEARRVLGALPRVFRDGAEPWVLAKMAVRIEELLTSGYGPAAIVRASEEITAARPITGDRDHVEALRAVKAALRANAFDVQAANDVDRCQGCGARRTGAVPCMSCDPIEVIEVIDLESVAEKG